MSGAPSSSGTSASRSASRHKLLPCCIGAGAPAKTAREGAANGGIGQVRQSRPPTMRYGPRRTRSGLQATAFSCFGHRERIRVGRISFARESAASRRLHQLRARMFQGGDCPLHGRWERSIRSGSRFSSRGCKCSGSLIICFWIGGSTRPRNHVRRFTESAGTTVLTGCSSVDRAGRLGRSGRGFKSLHSDHFHGAQPYRSIRSRRSESHSQHGSIPARSTNFSSSRKSKRGEKLSCNQ